jgi:glyoxylase-like metal-dependent hydrolase (beta-lactamase superfamily II)
MNDQVQIHAVRFASATSTKSANYLRYDVYREPDGPQICDFYYWVIRTPDTVVLVDAGFSRELAGTWGVPFDLDVPEGLAALGLTPADVDTVVLTHLHSDHAGNLELFENAQIVLQGAEYDFWFGPMAARGQFKDSVDAAHLASVSAARSAGRLRLPVGDVELSAQVRLRLAPGHTPGSQLVEVRVGGEKLVLAGDALHYFEELELDRPFAICCDVAGMYSSFDLIRSLVAEGATVIPGHDRRVAEEYASTPIGRGLGLLIDLGAPLGEPNPNRAALSRVEPR